jgi:polyisoprenoid-binding protein YceI
MQTKWIIDSNQSDILMKMKHSIVAYLAGTPNKFNGYVAMTDNEIEEASVEFSLDVTDNATHQESNKPSLRLNDFFDVNESPIISFKSTSFEKVAKNIHFLKGNLTIRNITKVVELDAEFIGFKAYNGKQKAAFEISGDINRKDFGLAFNAFNRSRYLSRGKNIKLIANLEFSA